MLPTEDNTDSDDPVGDNICMRLCPFLGKEIILDSKI